ncbi:MAG: ketoacyl-ACP synthase III [Rhodocyclaceae bacterium]|nr:ketoacyl-ACP synthase III [Rhodocyclaceae bacterium]MCE2721802.1 ketoacyl-ACP synthase III [Betaproteobacteria bacterium]MCA3022806.1 ketoacyl-ACP synthase III [Rhodocyclaceae bacterium]MCA3027350.1 ketoacyl-ACP synthase III [Rhodocyclaceae bacterium]MCA3034020.1 ketoacyl-ACP synthase III [Rhodocyclaceae bacterium]
MKYAALTGWGKCLPPAVLTNDDLSTFLPTDDAWIVQRTGMKERRISHVCGLELSYVAAQRALACAGIEAADVDFIIYGSCSFDEHVPNTASGLQARLGANKAAAMDVNTACTSFLYGMSTATAFIQSGVAKNVLVVGVEHISKFMDWQNRNVSVLFGDGAAAAVFQASNKPEGVIAQKLQCYADARQTLRVRGKGALYSNVGVYYGDTRWDFDGQEIFKKAVTGMGDASVAVLEQAGVTIEDVDLVVPHQANLRIIEAVAKRAGASMDKVFLTVHKYGNMSAATAPVALVDALDEGRVKPGGLVLIPAFGAGLTLSAHLVRWGGRVTPIATSDAELPPCDRTALEMVRELMAIKSPHERSEVGLMNVKFFEAGP